MESKVLTSVLALCLPVLFSVVEAQCDGEKVILKADTVQRTFDSPNYPRDYPSDSYCQWLLAAPSEDYIVRLDTLAMDLEATQGCVYDSITVYNGKSKKSSQLRRYCVGYFSIYSTGHYLLVVFKSDENYEASGFRLRYVALLKNPPSRTTPLTTTSKADEKGGSKNWVNTGALIGGVVGGVCFVIILGIVCGRCVGRGELRQPPAHRAAAFYHSHAPPVSPMHEPGGQEGSTISTAVHMLQNNNTVFMVSQAMGSNMSPTRFTSHITSGVTNMAFDGSGEHTVEMSATMGMVGPPPPSYTDTMMVTHPPAIPPTPKRRNPGTASGLAPPPLRASRDPGDGEQPGTSGEGASLPVPSVRIEISPPPEAEVPQQPEVSPSETGTTQQSETLPSEEESQQPSDNQSSERETMQQSETLASEEESQQPSGNPSVETETLRQSDTNHAETEASQQSGPSSVPETPQYSQSPPPGASSASSPPEGGVTQQVQIPSSGDNAQPDHSSAPSFQTEAPLPSEMSLSEANPSQQVTASPPETEASQHSEISSHETEVPQQSDISGNGEGNSQDLNIPPSETTASQKSDISQTETEAEPLSVAETTDPQLEASATEAQAIQQAKVCPPATETLQTETEGDKSQISNPEWETGNPQASVSSPLTLNNTTSSEDPVCSAAGVHEIQSGEDSETIMPLKQTLVGTELSSQGENKASSQNQESQEGTTENHLCAKESACLDESQQRSEPHNEDEDDDKQKQHQMVMDSEVNPSVQEDSASVAEKTRGDINECVLPTTPSGSPSNADNPEDLDNMDATVSQSDMTDTASGIQETTISTTLNESSERNSERKDSSSIAENPTDQLEGQSASETETQFSSEPQSQPTVTLTEYSDNVTEISSRTLDEPPEDITTELTALPADASEALKAAAITSPELGHRNTDLTSSTSSLPPPPSPHAVSDSDSESFPPAPAPLAMDTLGSPGLPRRESPSILLEASSDDECLNRGQSGYLGDGSEEDLYRPTSFASLSSHSSPLLTERQLRNSTSFPDIAKQVEVIKRETFQRADSQ